MLPINYFMAKTGKMRQKLLKLKTGQHFVDARPPAVAISSVVYFRQELKMRAVRSDQADST